jgi:hypothetical protein
VTSWLVVLRMEPGWVEVATVPGGVDRLGPAEGRRPVERSVRLAAGGAVAN